MYKKGRVYLIGAGCGKYDLITLRGKKLLSQCDTVVYDSLIDTRLLELAPEKAEKISVGKRAGRKSEKQENINAILVEKALQGKIVGRLKGGDPFVFGRGGEEITALSENGIEFEVVPGISSSVAAAELAGIPVTHRKISRGFHVITGHTSEDMLPENIQLYARLNDTLVFLMGLNRIAELSKALISCGKSRNTPAAVISKGCTSEQKTIRGDLGNIAILSEKNRIESPAVIIIGETAGLDFSRTLKRPLDNISVTVTGTKSFTARLDERLSNLGAEVYRTALIETAENTEQLSIAVQKLPQYKMIAFTSSNGVDIFFNYLKKQKKDIRSLSDIRFAVIGSGTAAALGRYGIYADIIPDSFSSQCLAEAIVNKIGSDKLLIARAENGSSQLTDILDKHNTDYDDLKIYGTTPVNSADKHINTDFIVFASSSGVRSFFDNGNTLSVSAEIIAIGSITSEELKKYGAVKHHTAECSDIDGIVSKILEIKENRK